MMIESESSAVIKVTALAAITSEVVVTAPGTEGDDTARHLHPIGTKCSIPNSTIVNFSLNIYIMRLGRHTLIKCTLTYMSSKFRSLSHHTMRTPRTFQYRCIHTNNLLRNAARRRKPRPGRRRGHNTRIQVSHQLRVTSHYINLRQLLNRLSSSNCGVINYQKVLTNLLRRVTRRQQDLVNSAARLQRNLH